MEVLLVTRNPGKVAAAQSVFLGSGILLIAASRDYVEIQADTSLEIALHTAVEAASESGIPAIREDHSLVINALGDGIPGPYAAYFEKRMPVGCLLRFLDGLSDRSGYFEVATVYAEPAGDTMEFVFRVPIVIAQCQRGSYQSGWNRVITLRGESRTLAGYPEKERNDVWSQNYYKIHDVLSGRR